MEKLRNVTLNELSLFLLNLKQNFSFPFCVNWFNHFSSFFNWHQFSNRKCSFETKGRNVSFLKHQNDTFQLFWYETFHLGNVKTQCFHVQLWVLGVFFIDLDYFLNSAKISKKFCSPGNWYSKNWLIKKKMTSFITMLMMIMKMQPHYRSVFTRLLKLFSACLCLVNSIRI